MPPVTLPPVVSDPARLEALESYAILDTPAEPGYDDIVALACRLCAVPVALVSLVTGDRQWFKARAGFPACETDLNSSVCAYALEQPDELLIIPDLTADPRTSANPLVVGEPFIRFYAGAPLVTPEGQVLGSLCVIDHQPRPEGLTDTQADDLRALARQVMTQLELRRALLARDLTRAKERRAYVAREALRDTQAALTALGDDLDAVLRTIIDGAMRAVPAAEGGAVQLIDGDTLEFRTVRGTLVPYQGLRIGMQGTLAGHCATTRMPQRMADAFTAPYVNRDLIAPLNLRSAVTVPLLRGDTLLGVLQLQSGKPEAFSAYDLELLRLFAGVTTSGLGEVTAHAGMRASDTFWRGLFHRLNEGFIIGEVVRDEAGRVTDWRYVEVNPAWGELVGIDSSTVAGRTIRAVFPGIEDEWISEFAQVVETGHATTFTRQVGSLRRWYEGRAFKLDGERFAVIFLEITARIEADARRNALLTLVDRLRDLTTIPEMTQAASEIVGRTLGASRAGFGLIVGDVEFIDIELDWNAPGQVSVAGRHRYDDFGNIRAPLQRGEALVVNDVASDPRTRDDASTWQGFDIAAFVHMPVRERDRTVAVFIAHDVTSRVWTPDELAFLRNVADRVEVSVARVRAQELQTVLNAELAHRLKNTLAIVQSLAASTLRGVTEREPVEAFERRVLALSRAHDVLMQKSWSAARMRAVMESVLCMQTDMDRFALDGPDMDISPQAALSLSLLLHELATNALKYGALSADAGRVRIGWRTEGSQVPTLVLDWSEHGGPAVTPPSNRGGFGSKLIRMGLMGTRSATLDFDPVGLRAEFRAPLAEVQVLVH